MQKHWSGLPFPSPMHESEKWKWSRSVMSDSSWPHGLQPTRLLHPWDFPGKSTGVDCLSFSDEAWQLPLLSWNQPPWYKVLDQDYWIMRNNTDRKIRVKENWSTQKCEGSFLNLWSWPRQPRGYLSERHQPTPMEKRTTLLTLVSIPNS